MNVWDSGLEAWVGEESENQAPHHRCTVEVTAREPEKSFEPLTPSGGNSGLREIRTRK